MQQNEFEILVRELCQLENLSKVLEALKSSEDKEIAAAAQSLEGQFSSAEIEGEKRIYHITVQENDKNEQEEFVEHVMNEGDDVIKFISWFFWVWFDVKSKKTYQAAGKTYKQPKRG